MAINWDDNFIMKLEEAQKNHFECVKTAERILEVLAGQEDDPLTVKEISGRAKARRARLIKSLKKLVQIKSLLRVGDGKKGSPYRYSYCRELENLNQSKKTQPEHNHETLKKGPF